MKYPKVFPKEDLKKQPGLQSDMKTQPIMVREGYKGSDKLKGKVALITGGDSGIGASCALHFAMEGAGVAILYFNERQDALKLQRDIEQMGGACFLIKGDIKDSQFCRDAIEKVVDRFGGLNILVNNAAMQFQEEDFREMDLINMETTFQTNVFPLFYLTQAALEYLKEGDTIINTTSITAFRGNPTLIDYSSSKGAILSFTRALSRSLAEKGIRVNAVAPGPIWTPLIPATFESYEKFGQNTPMGRAGQPAELGPGYVFLASEDSSYMTGQTIHLNGGTIVGG